MFHRVFSMAPSIIISGDQLHKAITDSCNSIEIYVRYGLGFSLLQDFLHIIRSKNRTSSFMLRKSCPLVDQT